MASLRIGAGLSTDLDAARATAEAAAEATAGIGGDEPTLVVAFVSSDHRDSTDEVASLLAERFPSAVVAGCTAQGIIGGAHELEDGPAISIWAGHLPDTDVRPFHLEFVETGDGEGEYRGLPDELPAGAAMIVLADPFSIPTGHLLATLNEMRPGVEVIGGIASGARGPGETRLILGSSVLQQGAVGVAVHGRVRVSTLVSQGCRPIGDPATITRADRNMIFELAGGRPVDQIRDIWTKATPRDRALMAGGPLFIGRVVDEYKTEFGRGDFIIRNVVGADPESGVVAVGDIVNVGETVQFHVRDPETADEDLRTLLGGVNDTPGGALLFTCNGRGTNLFDEPDHDATAVTKGLGGAPLAGFFAAGELGPIGGKNFLHGHTASLAMFVDSAAS